ncbi:MAG TPA: pyruvate dehydrogenase (acetyl-transferring), homodimeric type, partial [Thiobacillaceae bacterium]
IRKLDLESLREFRDRFDLPIPDSDLEKVPYYKPAADSAEMKYLRDRRAALNGHLPQRRAVTTDKVEVPAREAFAPMLEGSERPLSTTMAFVRILTTLMKIPGIGERCVPIVPDEARTFGMEAMFRQYGIYSSVGQLYKPEDAAQVMYYREDKQGRMLEEGINEAGAFSAWMAAATSYSINDKPMIPFYVYYSMFGFQRIGDFAWAAGDMQARGFLIGATAGRTTLNGEGLQHQDGHSHILSSTIPNCVSYDPTYSYELAVIVQDGLRRMYQEQENVFYYLTTMNENYPHPAMPAGAEEGIIRGMYKLKAAPKLPAKTTEKARGMIVQLLGSGTILREVEAAAEMLAADYGVQADVWSVTSFNELRRDGLEAQRWNLLHPLEKKPHKSWVEQCLAEAKGPVIAATDYMKLYADQIRPFVPGTYRVLGTDGFGRSDSRKKLREFFEVDRRFVVVAALSALAEEGKIEHKVVADAIKRYGIDPDKRNPVRS